MAFLKAVARFWYDFIVGDDWKIAFGVLVVLGAAGVVVAVGRLTTPWLCVAVGIGLAAAFCTAVAVDVRPKARDR